MEDIIELVIRGLGKAFLFISRILLVLIWHGICEKLLWYIGWPLTKAISLGHFPKQSITDIEKECHFTQAIVVIIGLIIPFVSAFYLVQFLSITTST